MQLKCGFRKKSFIINDFLQNPHFSGNHHFSTAYKVEKILKGSLDLISSPSRSHEHLNFLFLFFSAKANFPAHNLILHFNLKVQS